MRRFCLAFLIAFALSGAGVGGFTLIATTPAWAVQPDEMLKDPKLEARAREISEGLRCMVCQNESIDESNADLARDLRLLVRERLKAGDTDEEVRDYLVARYGEFVLLKPRFERKTFILWFAPLGALLLGAVIMFVSYRRRKHNTDDAPGATPLDEAEKAELKRIMGEG
ncbi:cytochrome c-type biogenesis protein CcmH [Breoghania corrubedonensis]|uniref:Cytochrome c-type biogenesis protein n=2 Tax=Breoghania corrubedonensis TaxID=665038 RepID=A0A2T5V1K4_9HYPH|nr:cytochrome c-type biogenesis protein CcmH [Breoghania corrubedonensis]